MDSTIGIAVAGLNASTARFQTAANTIAEKPNADPATNPVEADTAALDFKADAAVVKTAAEIMKSVLDIWA